MRAKANGLLHWYAYYTKEDNSRPELYDPYPNRNCLSCHGKGTVSFEVEDHQDNMEDINSGEVSCLDCHGPAHDLEGYYDDDSEDDDSEDDTRSESDEEDGDL